MPTPTQVAERLVAQAPDEAWLRALVDDLDRRLETGPLSRFMTLWGLSGAELGRCFGVSRQAVSRWLESGVPPGRAEAVADLAAATDLLGRYVKRERIPAVVRRPADFLCGSSLLDLALEGRHREVYDAMVRMFDLRRVQP
jgi:transcriptional regulator with XRE-family HTH domain